MKNRVANFFSVKMITLKWRDSKKTVHPGWFADKNEDEPILRQFMQEAGLKYKTFSPSVSVDQYDAVLSVAGKYDYSIETIGGPDDEKVENQL